MAEPTWRTSSYTDNGKCVQVADLGGTIAVRNSQRPEAGTVEFTRAGFAAWLAGCTAGEFDDLT